MKSKNEKRKAKKKERAQRQKKLEAKNWGLYESLFAASNFTPKVISFLRAKKRREELLSTLRTTIKVPEAGSSKNPVVLRLQQTIESLVREPDNRQSAKLSIASINLSAWLSSWQRRIDSDASAWAGDQAHHSKPKLDSADLQRASEQLEVYMDSDGSPYVELRSTLLNSGATVGLNEAIACVYPKFEVEGGIPYVRVALHMAAPQLKNVIIDGAKRTVYRCGYLDIDGSMKWAEWSTVELGLPGPDVRLPVYIQGHALDGLEDRTYLVNLRQIMRHKLIDSVLKPVAFKGQPGHVLIEFRVCGQRFGYLPAIRLDDMFVIRTFLFLTMQGTPEASKLRGILNLNRTDIQNLKLDELDTYLLTDLRNESEVSSALRECGCGHLLEWLPEAFGNPSIIGKTKEVISYLGHDLDKWKYRQQPPVNLSRRAYSDSVRFGAEQRA